MKLLETYYRINQAAGVSITIGKAGDLHIGLCEVVIRRHTLSFEKKVVLRSIGELKSHLPAKAYISLNLTGKGILQKRIAKTEEITAANFNTVLPNGNIADFYIQNFISGEHSFVSLIRKAEADQWIGQVSREGFMVLMLSLGSFPVQHILGQLNVYGEEIIFDGHVIRLNEQKEWLSYQSQETVVAPFPLRVESEAIQEQLLIAYAAAFQLVMSSRIDPVTTDVPILEAAFKELINDKKLKVYGAMILAVFLVLLLTNLIVFTQLNASNNQLTDQLSVSTQSTTNLQSVADQIKQKELLLQNLGWDEGINKSALVDQLASLLPPELTWSGLELNPVDVASSRVQKSLLFFNRQIRITGKSDRIIPVNEYIARVNTASWVKNVQLESYTYNNELNRGQFTIIIYY